MYTGNLDLTKQSGEDLLGLLVASNELLLEELFKYVVQDHLFEEHTIWIQRKFVFILHSGCKKLRDSCLKSICVDPKPFITSKNLLSLDKETLFDWFWRDDWQVEEFDVWESLIKWASKIHLDWEVKMTIEPNGIRKILKR